MQDLSEIFTLTPLPDGPTAPEVLDDGTIYASESVRGGSQLGVLGDCTRMWALKHPLDLNMKDTYFSKPPAWMLGTAVHGGVANFYGKELGADCMLGSERIKMYCDSMGQKGLTEQATALAMKYIETLKRDKPHWVPWAVEHQAMMDFGPAGIHGSSVDLLMYDTKDECLVELDHKTMGRVMTKNKFRYSHQYRTYRLVLEAHAQQNGLAPGTGKVVVGVIPTGKTNWPKQHFAECPKYLHTVGHFALERKEELEALTRAEGRDPYELVARASSRSCHGQYSDCAFAEQYCFLG